MAAVLVVDDEEPVRTLIRHSLEPDEHSITEAANGAEALTKCKDQTFDLIVTDLVMPEKSGIDLIIEIKKTTPNVKIIAVSGGGGITGRFDYLAIAKLVGAFTIINKPFAVSDLRKTVNEVLADGNNSI